MKKIFTILVCLIIFIQYGNSQNIEQRLNTLITSGDYLELNRQFHYYEDSISPFMQAMIKPLLSSSLNKHEKAANELDFLLNNYTNELGNGVLSFIAMLGQQLYYIGEYDAAATILNGTISSLKEQQAPNELIIPLDIIYKKVNALKGISKTSVSRILGKSNQIKMINNLKCSEDGWYITGQINGKDEPFLLDTGAGINVISESFAQKHKIRVLQDSIPTSGGFGHSSFTKMGVIDSIIIGNIIYRNAIVGIAKDNDILPQNVQDSIGYKINAILGIDFLKAIGGIIIHPQENIVEIPSQFKADSQISPNIMIVDNAPFVECTINNARLILNCDTGLGLQGYITLSSYDKNKDFFKDLEVSNQTNIQFGGFAGTNQYKNLHAKTVLINIGNKKIPLKDFNIIEKEMLHDGGLGIECFRKFNTITLDLTNMYLKID